jgi:hypothetical protein
MLFENGQPSIIQYRSAYASIARDAIEISYLTTEFERSAVGSGKAYSAMKLPVRRPWRQTEVPWRPTFIR